MDRSNTDPFWNHVVRMDDRSTRCEFCERPFPKGTSISRIKWHLSGEKGRGVAICTGQVPKEVQEAALQAMRGGNKRQKTIASSSRVHDNVISSCSQVENNEVDNLAGDAGRIQMAVQDTEQGVGERRTSSRAEAGNLMENLAGERMHIGTSMTAEGLIVDAHETRAESSQAPDIVSQSIGRSWGEIRNLLMEDDIENETGGLLQPVIATSSPGGLTHNICETRGDPLPTSSTKIAGRAFEKNKEEIWSWLIDDEVSSVGIYGMGGVGKTRMLQHIHNQLLERLDISHHVYWVAVSRDFSIYRLQNLIAKCLHLDLSNEDDELRRAVKLSKELKKKQKWILIGDDLWNSFELHEVGIPVPVKGCKLIVTTRSEQVCQRMDIQKKIKVKPLSREEAWTLFMEKLGRDIALSPEVKKIAQSITEECDGLPLGIITMAGTMKGVDDIHEWRNALEDLKQSRVRQDDMENEVFRILRFSYMQLNDSTLQQCFLYCALFPEDYEIPREDLIGYLIDEGVIKGLKRREAEFDKGHSMLNRLENVCLLESVTKRCGDYRCVKMHDLIRDMAIQIQQGDFEVMVKAGAQLKEWSDAEEWTENLLRVSLMQNRIEEIPSSYSPRCANLSTLLLCSNRKMRFIADSFFNQLFGLKVLDLSNTNIEKLPHSVSNLVSLTGLLLKRCLNLRHVPSLENLRALKRLDLNNTALEDLPQGLKQLTNLRYLRLNECGEKKFPSGVLPKLSHLQVFVLQKRRRRQFGWGEYATATVIGKEVACLKKFETLECHFEGHSDFLEYLKSRDETQSLSTCKILVGKLKDDHYSRMIENYCRNRSVGLCINRELMISRCNDATSLCDIYSLKYATELERIYIEHCNSMESLVSSSWFCSALLPSISPSNGVFSGLKDFSCYGCKSVKKLFPLVLLPNLVNLEVIRVERCKKMEEIIATKDDEGVMGEESSSYSITEFNLPKLKILELTNLPELKSICNAKMICDSLQEIVVVKCQKLKRMPICLPLHDNGQPSLRRMVMYPKAWWESAEWERPNATDVL